MKTPAQVITEIERRVARTWHTDLTCDTVSWPHDFPLGQPTKTDLETNYGAFHDRVFDLHQWARTNGVQLRTARRLVRGSSQTIPTHVVVPDLDSAARLAPGSWTVHLASARGRLQRLQAAFPTTLTAKILRTAATYSDLDFELLLAVCDWFRSHADEARGLTPRQVPIPGVHAKWLNTSQPLITALTGLDSLDLADRHPPRIHFTYLDPDHRATGGRWHDSATVGDAFVPAYVPRIVLISENKDTAITFPTLPEGIAVEGDGFGGKTAASFPWLAGAPTLIYWGDMDRHGYEILNGWRADGVPVASILMDETAYETYEPFGTNTYENGRDIEPGDRKPLPHLTASERAVYNRITDPASVTHRRIEQERVPLDVARKAVHATLNRPVQVPI